MIFASDLSTAELLLNRVPDRFLADTESLEDVGVFVTKNSEGIGIEPTPMSRDEGEAIVVMSRVAAASLKVAPSPEVEERNGRLDKPDGLGMVRFILFWKACQWVSPLFHKRKLRLTRRSEEVVLFEISPDSTSHTPCRAQIQVPCTQPGSRFHPHFAFTRLVFVLRPSQILAPLGSMVTVFVIFGQRLRIPNIPLLAPSPYRV